MAILKCKMCGGDLSISEGMSVCECEYCGSMQTVPSADNEKKLALFTRANKLRFGCEFDKAAGVYETIVADFPEEAEAYWGLVLCKYGIEYVDDPATGKKIPTCHRSSFESVMDDSNFELVMENADTVSRGVYREEAKQIEELRKGIIEVSSKEEPYDIFICYKESDDKGDRTVDSVIAQDVYTELTSKGYRVFFSRITLEDKLGKEYEPYIFAALNSAKIMLAFGTNYEYYNAVWVKNEWSRFLQLIAKGEKKTLIPCYKGIDAYDMPKEFARLQAQDMGKVGATQDLLRGIEKILPKTAKTEQSTVQQTAAPQSATTETLLKRAFMYLEDGNWQSADEYCEKVLDIQPENANAYLGKLMVELKVQKKDKLANCADPFDNKLNCQKLVRFADDSLKKEIREINDSIRRRNTEAENKSLYYEAMKKKTDMTGAADKVKNAESYDSFKVFRASYNTFLNALNKLPSDYQDIAAQKEQGEKLNRELSYNVAKSWLGKAEKSSEGIKSSYESVIDLSKHALNNFTELGDYEDSAALCEKAQALHTDAVYYKACHNSKKHPNEAKGTFRQLGDYKNSKANIELCKQIDELLVKKRNVSNAIDSSNQAISSAKSSMGNSPEYAKEAISKLKVFGLIILIVIIASAICSSISPNAATTVTGIGGLVLIIYVFYQRSALLDRRFITSLILVVTGLFIIVFPIELLWEYHFWNSGNGKYKRSIKKNNSAIANNSDTLKNIEQQIDTLHQQIMQ